jgi:hypothetical protein
MRRGLPVDPRDEDRADYAALTLTVLVALAVIILALALVVALALAQATVSLSMDFERSSTQRRPHERMWLCAKQ